METKTIYKQKAPFQINGEDLKPLNVIYQFTGEDLINLFKDFQAQLDASKQKEEHYTLKQACEVTGKNRTTLWTWEQRGYLTPVRMGKTLLYLKSDIDRIMNTKRKG